MVSPIGGAHRHCGEELNDGLMIVFRDRWRRKSTSRTRGNARDRRRLRPSPHAPSKEECEAAPYLDRKPSSTESDGPQRLVPLCHCV